MGTATTYLSIAIILAASVLACNSVGQDCTLIGCQSGLMVHLDRAPAPPFRLEITTPESNSVFVQECSTTDHCSNQFFFPEYIPKEVSVRVVAGSDTTLVTGLKPQYNQFAPNGVLCGPICHQATVEVVMRP